MKTEPLSTLPATPLLRVAYQQIFNEEHIRVLQTKVQRLKPVYEWDYRTHTAASEKANWDDAWFASYE